MKLRYYLRGLGIGMIVTAFLMGAALDGQDLSDTEIKARAAALGMVEKDSRTLSDIQASNGPGDSSADMSDTISGSDAASGPDAAVQPTSRPDTAVQPTSGSDAASRPTSGPDTAVQPTSGSDAASRPTAGPDGTAESITFEIRAGQSSNSVSKALAEAGLVEDAAAFDQYLVDNGYSRRVRAGTYEIPLGSTEEEIAKKIAGSR